MLLDSSVLIPLSRGELPMGVVDRLPPELLLSHVVVGEYLAGIRNPEHRRSDEAAAWFRAFLRDVAVLPGTRATAAHDARLHHHTRRSGRPIPLNDLWIAATAAEHEIRLLTRDAHFRGLPGVEAEVVDPA